VTQYAIGDGLHPEFDDGWRVYLRRIAPHWYARSFDEACRRQRFHDERHTLQTSGREQLPRSLMQEWMHLKGEVCLAILLQARGFPLELEDLNWGKTSAGARQQSRQGNVVRGVSVYVPEEANRGLIVRGEERRDYPELRFVLMWERRSGRMDEYYFARGHLLAREADERGTNFGWKGNQLRHPEDRLVPPTSTDPMSTFMESL
jgi:hypothetical protein